MVALSIFCYILLHCAALSSRFGSVALIAGGRHCVNASGLWARHFLMTAAPLFPWTVSLYIKFGLAWINAAFFQTKRRNRRARFRTWQSLLWETASQFTAALLLCWSASADASDADPMMGLFALSVEGFRSPPFIFPFNSADAIGRSLLHM